MPPRPQTALPALVAMRRQELGLSHEAVAARIGKSRTFISNLENERSRLTNADTIGDLAEALEIDRDRLFLAAGIIPPDLEDSLLALDPERLRRIRAYIAKLA